MPLANPDILGYQRRTSQIGAIRIGESVMRNGKLQPVRLDTFKFTSPSRATLDAVAAQYGGTVTAWDRRRGQYQVTTAHAALDVWVPPRGDPSDTTMELWDGGKCLRKCDGARLLWPPQAVGKPCQCPLPEDPGDWEQVQNARAQRETLAKQRPPTGCSPLTRIRVTMPKLPGLGEWKLNTKSVTAAEHGDTSDLLIQARDGQTFLPAVLLIEWLNRIVDGSPYPVPALRIGVSIEQIAAKALPAGPEGFMAQLAASAPPLALPAGSPPQRPSVTLAADRTPEAGPDPDFGGHSANCDPEAGYCHPACPASAAPDVDPDAITPQRLADRIMASTSPDELRALGKQAELLGFLDRHVTTTDPDGGQGDEMLREVHRARWLHLRKVHGG
jgi:hypothetical protein